MAHNELKVNTCNTVKAGWSAHRIISSILIIGVFLGEYFVSLLLWKSVNWLRRIIGANCYEIQVSQLSGFYCASRVKSDETHKEKVCFWFWDINFVWNFLHTNLTFWRVQPQVSIHNTRSLREDADAKSTTKS